MIRHDYHCCIATGGSYHRADHAADAARKYARVCGRELELGDVIEVRELGTSRSIRVLAGYHFPLVEAQSLS